MDKNIGNVLSKEMPSKIPEGGAIPFSDLPRCTQTVDTCFKQETKDGKQAGYTPKGMQVKPHREKQVTVCHSCPHQQLLLGPEANESA